MPVVLATAALVGCGREGVLRAERDGDEAIRIALDTTRGSRAAAIVVTGLDVQALKALRNAQASMEAWQQGFHVTIVGNEVLPVAGRYVVSDTAAEFHPFFPFDAGQPYAVRFDPAKLPVRSASGAAGSAPVVTAVLALPAVRPRAPTIVRQVFPTSAVLPENQLRFYLEFSAPMSFQPAAEFIHLLDDRGREVPNVFRHGDRFWNDDRTRYTLLFQPGRVKRGIRPNRELGRPIQAGRAYTLVIDARWHDAAGRPLAVPFEYRFRVGPPNYSPIVLGAWKIRPPRVGSRDALVITFPYSLDYALLKRTLSVATASDEWLRGDIEVERAETEWRFTPASPWRAGGYKMVVLPVLEDPVGNRIDRPFEIVSNAGEPDTNTVPERYTLLFTVQ